MVFSSISTLTPGMPPAREPVAMTMFFVSRTVSAPLAPATFTLPMAGIEPTPKWTSILFFFIRKATPSTLAFTTASLCAIIALRSSFGGSDHHPELRQAVASFGEHLGSVQQRLRRDAADVEAGAAERLVLFDYRRLQSELGAFDGADIAAGPGTDHDDIVGGGHACCFLQRPPVTSRIAPVV